MWWGIALGLVLGEVLRACANHLWRRFWRVDTTAKAGRQVSYW